MKGFKAFLMRGNVIDLAVAVVIGAAFTNIVNSVVSGVINPIVGAFGTQDLNAYTSCLKGPCTADSGILIKWGAVLGAGLQFLITAAVVYFCMVLPMNHLLNRRKKEEVPVEIPKPAEEPKDVQLLSEIRDLLARQS
ncbi:large conductance mechanosensitive channel protein MscL [Streptacidiphilus monticola]|jgi:large conductance mechanosensitive channel|uniref:Large-conductance mechanosensitive channel n=1 Tax=Streptacidiphilus monticola TaxID=2161674 RepID=A0ABW1FYQ4_9ACTN